MNVTGIDTRRHGSIGKSYATLQTIKRRPNNEIHTATRRLDKTTIMDASNLLALKNSSKHKTVQCKLIIAIYVYI